MSLFSQVWLWSLLAFAVGVVLTWLLLVLPVRTHNRELVREVTRLLGLSTSQPANSGPLSEPASNSVGANAPIAASKPVWPVSEAAAEPSQGTSIRQQPALAKSVESAAQPMVGAVLPKRQRDTAIPGGFNPRQAVHPVMRVIERRTPSDEVASGESLFKPEVSERPTTAE